MVFSSIAFIFYFLPLFFLLYYLAPARYKNPVILAGSMLFYSWSAPRFLFVILGTTLVDFYVVRQMGTTRTPRARKWLLTASVLLNIGLLFYFKYSNFFVDNLNHLLALSGVGTLKWLQIALPVGISFYTFETITYVVDVYRGTHKPLRNFGDYLLYILFFPKLIAGPIIRFHEFASQMHGHIGNDHYENRLRGLYRFVLGLARKVLIANILGTVVDDILSINSYARLDSITAWAGALGYTFQIYFDFSGYSDMALGLGQMMGFKLPENFNDPYTASSITDFWRRWHITLGSWMRNYLYIPLGGNRAENKWRVYFNLWIVFVASGLWHGAAWAFLLWGMYHGTFLVLERLFLGRWLEKLGKLSVVYTFVVVIAGWVLFRIEYVRPSLQYLSRMFIWRPYNSLWFFDGDYVPTLCIATFFSFFTLTRAGRWCQQKVFFEEYTPGRHWAMTTVSAILLVLCASRITAGNFNPFIYFRF